MVNPELTDKLVKDLEKSGFGSEMRAIKTFLTQGWRCTGVTSYYDLDQEQTRQIDLTAYKIEWAKSLNGYDIHTVEYYIDGEVKKSEKPWIVFKEELDGFFSIDAWNNLVEFNNLGFDPSMLTNAMSQDSLISTLKWKAYGMHESFKKPEAPSRWYSALVTICKAAESTFATNTSYFEKRPDAGRAPDGAHMLVFVKPIIILDGMLFAASLSDSADLQIEEIAFAPVEFAFKSKNCIKGKYSVDIVTLNHLPEYIELSGKRQKSLLNAMVSAHEKNTLNSPPQ